MQHLRTTPSSRLEDKSQDSIQSILDNLDTLESDDDFEDEWDMHSTGMGDLQSSFGTKDDINRLETQLEVMKANQNVILETQRGISSLLSEKAKKVGIALRIQEPCSHAESQKKIKLPTPILNSTRVTSSAVSNDLADFGMPDEHLHESLTASSLDSELIKSPPPIRFDFFEKEILETKILLVTRTLEKLKKR